jgi:Tol biopolymer transport system component
MVNPDGTGLRRVTAGPEYELLVDWSTDGTRLFYAVPGAEGMGLRSIDLASGAPRDLFVINAKDISAAFSPDGRQIAYLARLPASMAVGLFLASADGTSPRVIARLGDWAMPNPLWFPDGQWLIVSVVDPSPPTTPVIPSLINPSTCQAIPLVGLEGTVQDWSR